MKFGLCKFLTQFMYAFVASVVFAHPVLACDSNQIDTGDDCIDVGFSVTTVNTFTGGDFKFKLSPKGVFYVDCGVDGTLKQGSTTIYNKTLNRINGITTGSPTEYKCNYSSGGAKTIKFGIKYTDGVPAEIDNMLYDSGSTAVAAISFSGTAANAQLIKSISGSLGAVFPTLGAAANKQPKFASTFKNATNLESIPSTLFNGVTGNTIHMFDSTFYNCTGLTYIPYGLFAGNSGSSGFMFSSTFYGCSGLAPSAAHPNPIPHNLFDTINTPSGSLFSNTFRNCTGLTSIPYGLFKNIVVTSSNASAGANLFQQTFRGCTGLASLPDDLFAGVTAAATYMFSNTFADCTGLTGFVPLSMFQGLIDNGSPTTTNFMLNIFNNTGLYSIATQCPYDDVTPSNYATYWSPTGACGKDKFNITTTADTTQFDFELSAIGTFYVDCDNGGTLSGDGVSGDTITRTDTTLSLYSCTYTNAGTHKIVFGGGVTGNAPYSTVPTTPTIGFTQNTANSAQIESIGGSLGALFPTVGNNEGEQPRFFYTLSSAINIKSIPRGLFNGVTGSIQTMFEGTFYGSGIVSIPSGLFHTSTLAPHRMFYDTFSNCQNLISVPDDLFANITQTSGSDTFTNTFNGCTSLENIGDVSYIPKSMFAGLFANNESGFMKNTFQSTQLLSTCPAGTFQIGTDTGYTSPKVSCVQGITVSYSCGSNATGNAPNAQMIAPGTPITVAENVTCSKNNMIFVGWDDSDPNTDTVFYPGGSFTSNSSVTLVAKYVSPKFSVTTIDNVAAGDEFTFSMTSAGTFWVDCGIDGVLSDSNNTLFPGNRIVRSDVSRTEYKCTYSTPGQRTIKFDSANVTQYMDYNDIDVGNWTEDSNTEDPRFAYGSISFKGNTLSQVAGGNLMDLLPVLGSGPGETPLFIATFMGCENLNTVGDLFKFGNGYTPVTHMFTNTFGYCSKLTDIPGNLFSGIKGGADRLFKYTFRECEALSTIPYGLFAGVSNSAQNPANGMFMGTFRGAGLRPTAANNNTPIPDNLFAGVTTAAPDLFKYTFGGCAWLTEIPDDLFAHTIGSASAMFQSTFNACLALRSIPRRLFAGVSGPAPYMFNDTFGSCQSLTEIPDDLFTQCDANDVCTGVAGPVAESMFHHTFRGCTGLQPTAGNNTPIPSGLFREITGVAPYAFYGTFFGCTGLEAVPDGLFKYLGVNATASDDSTGMFRETFRGCTGLTSIEPGVFGGVQYGGAEMFRRTFNECSSLTDVPSDLFANIQTVTPKISNDIVGTFDRTFADCGNLAYFGNDANLKYIPKSMFQGLFNNNNSNTSDVMYRAFNNTALGTTCPSNMTQVMTYADDINPKVMCEACPSCNPGTNVTSCNFAGVSNNQCQYTYACNDGYWSAPNTTSGTIANASPACPTNATYAITYDANGGTFNNQPDSYQFGTGANIAGVATDNTGYTFAGWCKNPDLNALIGESAAVGLGYQNGYGNTSDHAPGFTMPNTMNAEEYGINTNNTFVVDYGDNGKIHGHSRCSTRGVTTPYYETTDKTFASDHFVTTLTDETRQSDAIYCYCQLDGYTPYNGTIQTISSAPWVFSGSNYMGTGIVTELCTDACAFTCSYSLSNQSLTVDNTITIDPDTAFRQAMFDSIDLQCATPQSIGANEFGDMHFTAKWTANTINLQFTTAHGTVQNAPVSCTYGDTFTLPGAIADTDGYTFNKWTINGNEFDGGEEIECSNTNLGVSANGATATIVADWTGMPFDVTYSCNSDDGGLGIAPTETNQPTVGNTYTPLPYGDCHKNVNDEDYMFIGWAVFGTNDIVYPGQSFTWNYAENKTLTAQYTKTKFSIKTVDTLAAGDVFHMGIGANGTFYIDYGDGYAEKKVYNDNPVRPEHYTAYTYNTAGEKVIKMAGLANEYSTTGYPAIKFGYTNSLIKEFHGSVGAIFPTITDENNNIIQQPLFKFLCSDCYALQKIPSTLFSGVHGAGVAEMFQHAFSYTHSLASIPSDLFANITSGASYMFAQTFAVSRVPEIPDGLFDSITNSAPHMFDNTFASTNSLRSIPVSLFSHFTAAAEGMFNQTFRASAYHDLSIKLSQDKSVAYIPKSMFAGLFANNQPNDTDFMNAMFMNTRFAKLPEGCPSGTMRFESVYDDDLDPYVICVPAYNITYENMTGIEYTSTGMPDKYGKTIGATINGQPTRTGYTFGGWCDIDANDELVNCAFTRTIDENATDDKVFYAKWTANTITVQFTSTTGTAPGNQTCTYDDTLQLPGPITDGVGAVFMGWDAADVAGSPHHSSTSVPCTVDYLSIDANNEATITANWAQCTCRASSGVSDCTLNGGTNNTCQFTYTCESGLLTNDTHEDHGVFSQEYQEGSYTRAQSPACNALMYTTIYLDQTGTQAGTDAYHTRRLYSVYNTGVYSDPAHQNPTSSIIIPTYSPKEVFFWDDIPHENDEYGFYVNVDRHFLGYYNSDILESGPQYIDAEGNLTPAGYTVATTLATGEQYWTDLIADCENITLPAPGTKTGYTFNGWTITDEETGEPISIGTTGDTYCLPYNETVVQADWTPNVITLHFDNGGHGTLPDDLPTECTYGDEFELPGEIWDGVDVIFNGWHLNGERWSDGEWENASYGANIFCDEYNLGVTSGTATITAAWKDCACVPGEYVASCLPNGGTDNQCSFEYICEDGHFTYNEETGETPTSGTFIGEYYADTSEEFYESPTCYIGGQYVVTLNKNGGIDGTNNLYTIFDGGIYRDQARETPIYGGGTIDVPSLTRYVYLDADGGEIESDNIAVSVSFTGYFGGNPSVPYVESDGFVTDDGRDAANVPHDVTWNAGWTCPTVTLPTPTKAGYDFGGWYDETETQIDTSTWCVQSDTTLHARWVNNTINITFNTAYGTAPAQQSCRYGETFTLPNAITDGVDTIFVGWKNANGTTFAPGATIPCRYDVLGTQTNDATITAVWNNCTCTYGEHVAACVQNGGTNNQCAFRYICANGWLTPANASSGTFNSSVATNVSPACSVQGSFDITLDPNGGAVRKSTLANVPINVMLPQLNRGLYLPVRGGYVFNGYYDADGKQYYDANGAPLSIWDKQGGDTLYAHWNECGTGYYCNGTGRYPCPYSDTTTIGFGAGADEASDCGHVLRIGDNKLYLRRNKKTPHSLAVEYDDGVYYGNASDTPMNMSYGVDHKLRAKLGNSIFYIYDDSAD